MYIQDMYMQNKNAIRKVCKESQTLCNSESQRKDAANTMIHSFHSAFQILSSSVTSRLYCVTIKRSLNGLGSSWLEGRSHFEFTYSWQESALIEESEVIFR